MLTEGAIAKDHFAVEISKISNSEMEELRRLAARADWRPVEGRGYDTADSGFWEPHKRAFFIRMKPSGTIPRHHDVFIDGTTHHLVLQTNPFCNNCWLDTMGRERTTHLKAGYRYAVERSPLHWAYNHGETDRVHLLVEFA